MLSPLPGDLSEYRSLPNDARIPRGSKTAGLLRPARACRSLQHLARLPDDARSTSDGTRNYCSHNLAGNDGVFIEHVDSAQPMIAVGDNQLACARVPH